jgi:autoinducer 2 (AI-2) kinase
MSEKNCKEPVNEERPSAMGKRSKDGYLLALDGGTGTVRAVLFNLAGERVHRETRTRAYLPDPLGGEYIQIFDAKNFWSEICNLIRRTLDATGIPPESVRAVSATAQRFSYVFLDDRFEVLYAGPNLDARGFYVQEQIETRMGEEYYRATGQWPPLSSALARLLWFQEQAVDVFDRIRTILMLNDWILYKLCGQRHTEVTAASGSGFLDVAGRQWSEKIPKAFGIDAGLLPPIASAGEVIGEVFGRAAKETGLHPGTPVVVGGADTQCALLGAGMRDTHESGIVAGTTAPVCLLMDTPYVAPEKCFWTSCHMEPTGWILEANSQWAGYVLQWMKDLLLKVRERPSTDSEIYAWIEKKASAAPPGAGGTFAFLGTTVVDEASYYDVPPGIFRFPPPAHPVMAAPARARDFLRALLENIAFALRGNQEKLLKAKPCNPERVYLTGGLANSRLFCQIVSDCLDLPVSVGRIREASALGAAICAATGIKAFSDIRDAQRALVHEDTLYEPKKENIMAYENAYQDWRGIYEKLGQL